MSKPYWLEHHRPARPWHFLFLEKDRVQILIKKRKWQPSAVQFSQPKSSGFAIKYSGSVCNRIAPANTKRTGSSEIWTPRRRLEKTSWMQECHWLCDSTITQLTIAWRDHLDQNRQPNSTYWVQSAGEDFHIVSRLSRDQVDSFCNQYVPPRTEYNETGVLLVCENIPQPHESILIQIHF